MGLLRDIMANDAATIFSNKDDFAEDVIYEDIDTATKTPVAAIVDRKPRRPLGDPAKIPPRAIVYIAIALLPTKPNGGNGRLWVSLVEGEDPAPMAIARVDSVAGRWVLELS